MPTHKSVLSGGKSGLQQAAGLDSNLTKFSLQDSGWGNYNENRFVVEGKIVEERPVGR